MIKKVYISSTYKDLVRERQAAAQAVRRLGHHALAMEDYVATDERPLEKCLADVRSCEVYIGIFARRYGFIPAGYDKSITHMEYDTARAGGIPCLIFHRSDAGALPAGETGEQEDLLRIEAFREELATTHIISRFSSPEELGGLVSAAVSNLLMLRQSAGPAPDIPSLLPYLSNRSQQEHFLAAALQRYATGTADSAGQRPLVCYIHGHEMEAHHWFLERLQKVMLPRLLLTGQQGSFIPDQQLSWPSPDIPAASIAGFFQADIADALCRNRFAAGEEIAQRIASQRMPMLFYTLFMTQDWSENGREVNEALLDFWSQWPDVSASTPVICCVLVKYKDTAGLGFLARRRAQKANEQLSRYLETLTNPLRSGVNTVVLPPLQALQRSDVENWAGSREVKDCCHWQDLLKDIRRLFERKEVLVGDQQIRMELLGEELAALLVKHRR